MRRVTVVITDISHGKLGAVTNTAAQQLVNMITMICFGTFDACVMVCLGIPANFNPHCE